MSRRASYRVPKRAVSPRAGRISLSDAIIALLCTERERMNGLDLDGRRRRVMRGDADQVRELRKLKRKPKKKTGFGCVVNGDQYWRPRALIDTGWKARLINSRLTLLP